MKTNLSSFIFILLTIAGGMGLLAGNAQCADEAMPLEVKALIGTRIPPHVSSKGLIGRADIPNFVPKNSVGAAISFEEGVFNGKWPAFVIERDNKDMSTEILAIQMIPKELIDWEFFGGQFHNVEGRYSLSEHCQSHEDDERWIVGLVKPEKGKADCGHNSKRIKQTWMIDQQTGRITPISSQGLQCYYLTIGSC